MRKYEYLISFHYKHGNGTVYIVANEKIESAAAAIEVAKDIERNNNIENVCIINILLLREFEERTAGAEQ